MRPLVLVGILAALCGCSLRYEGTSFSAVEKPRHMAEGEAHPIQDAHPGETSRPPETGVPQEGTLSEESTEAVEPPAAVVGRTPSVFPNTMPPSGAQPDHTPSEGGE